MSEVTYLPSIGASRLETGPVQFGEDWPGVFIRGDSALQFSFILKHVLDSLKGNEEYFGAHAIDIIVLEGLYKTLASCRV